MVEIRLSKLIDKNKRKGLIYGKFEGENSGKNLRYDYA